MPPSERILKKLNKSVVLSDESESPIMIGEFDGIDTVQEWNAIQNLKFINISSLTELPTLPKKIKELTLENTSIKSLPMLPKSLIHLHLIKNKSLTPPEKLPDKLTRITLRENGFKIIPQMPIIDSNKIIIYEKSLEEPFDGLYNTYKLAKTSTFEQPMRAFFTQLNGVWEMIHTRRARENARKQALNVLSSRLTMSRTNKLPRPVNRLIASYLSGKPERDSVNTQISKLHSDYNAMDGGKKTRKNRQKGGDLCKEDKSEYEIDKDTVLGKGVYGIVYSAKNNPDLAIKVQYIPTKGNLGKDFTWKLQNELAIATKAGEMGFGPRIYHLAICNTNKPNEQKIIWVMDRIYGDTVFDILEKYKKELKKQGYPKKEIAKLELEKRKGFNDELVRIVQILEEKGIEYDDIHGGNIMYGSIQGGEQKLYIIDYGEFSFSEPNNSH